MGADSDVRCHGHRVGNGCLVPADWGVGIAGRLVAGVEGKGVNREDVFLIANEFNTLRTEWLFNEVTLQQFFWKVYGAGVAAERERIAKWVEEQRNDIPATGIEFASAIRARSEK